MRKWSALRTRGRLGERSHSGGRDDGGRNARRVSDGSLFLVDLERWKKGCMIARNVLWTSVDSRALFRPLNGPYGGCA
jgi:hypothetical protein